MELRLQGDFYEKLHLTMENYELWEAGASGLKIFGPRYQKAHPYAKSGRMNRLAYVAVAVFKRYMAAIKCARSPIGNSSL